MSIDLSDIDGTFEVMDKILSVIQQKGDKVKPSDFTSLIPNSSIPDKSHLLKLDFPHGPEAIRPASPNVAVKLVESPRTEQHLRSVGLTGRMEFQQPIKTQWKNVGFFTTTPFKRPVDGKMRSHEGLDMEAPGGTPLFPIAPGVVTSVSYEQDPENINTMGGTTVWISHYGGKIASYYAHMDNVTVRVGQQVDWDTQIGTVGRTGNARTTSTHLHLGVRCNGSWVDPASFIGNSPTSQRIVRE